MKTYYVYSLRVENEDTPFYVGKSFIGSKRFYQHQYYGSNGRRHSATYSKIKSAKEKNLRVVEDILMTTQDEEKAFLAERAYISLYGRRDNGTGILCNHTDGGEGASGNLCSATTKLAVIEANKRRVWDEAAREKQAKKVRGRSFSVESRQKLSKAKLKPIDMFNLNGDYIRSFDSVGGAAKELNTHRTYISYVLNDYKDNWNGYVFKYKIK